MKKNGVVEGLLGGLTFFFFLVFLVLISFIMSGCACADIQNSARDQAGFYSDNYPKLTSNEKAEQLMKQFDNDRTPYTAKKKTYKVECIYIYDYSGRQIFPEKSAGPKGTLIKSEIIHNKEL